MASYLHSQLSTFRDAGKYCDLIIQVQDEKFQCHRVVLAAVYEYFDAMFGGTGGTYEEGRMNEITLDGIKAIPFKVILDYAYTGCESSIEDDNVLDVLRTSDFLGASRMVENCVNYIQDNLHSLDEDQRMEIYRFASSTNMTSLLECFGKRYVKNFKVFSECDGWLFPLSLDDLSLLLSENRKPPAMFKTFLHIRNVDLILDTIIRWTCHLYEERASLFEELCRFIDFEYVSAEYLKLLSEKYGIQCDNKAFLKECLIDYFRRESNEPEISPLPASSMDTNRSTIHAFVKYPGPGFGILSLNEDRVPNMWELTSTKEIFDFPFKNERSIQSRDNLYFFGCGRGSNGNSSSFLVFPSLDRFPDSHEKKLKCPPCKSDKFDMCGTSKNVYWYNADPHNRAHYINLPAHSWSASLSEEETHRGIYKYDFHLDNWYSVAKMKKTVANSCMTADDSRLYLIGGRDEEGRDLGGYAQAYDDRAPEWQELPKTVNTYCDAVSCAFDGKIYVSDGEVLEKYDSVAGIWMVVSSKDNSRSTTNENKIFNKKRMVPFRNLLWEFNFDEPDQLRLETNIIDPYDDHTPKYWRTSSSLQKAVQWAFRFGFKMRWIPLDADSDDGEEYDSSSSTSFNEEDDLIETNILDMVVFKSF